MRHGAADLVQKKCNLYKGILKSENETQELPPTSSWGTGLFFVASALSGSADDVFLRCLVRGS